MEPDPRRFSQFLGPNRDAVLRGVHLAPAWDDLPPTELWRQPIGSGWSGFAVADGLAVTQEQRNGRAMVVAYDLESGAVRWSQPAGEGFESTMTGDGPRTTPTIDNGRVYAFGADGVLRALDLATGRSLFERDVLEENAGRAPTHGIASSPLVTDGFVIVLAGGGNGRSLVAYDAETGLTRWAGGDDEAAYSSPLVATLGGVRQIVVLNLRHLTGHDPQTGEVLWRDRWPDRPEKVSQPVVLEGDRVFASMGYGVGARLVQITRRPDGGLNADLQWETRRLKAKFTQVVEYGGFLYGLDEGVLVCLDPANGERRWKRGRYGHGQVLLVEDLLLLQAEDGRVVLIDPNPEELTVVASFQAVEGKTWATPALAGDLLIVRSETEVACYRLPTEPGA
jgi:outer membrane protein assembly factor BamB